MLNHIQLRELIIVPTLNKLKLYSESAVELLVFTCAVETQGGSFLKQVGGPALGIYQMEPNTYKDIWNNYIRKRGDFNIILAAQFAAPYMQPENRLVYDLEFATAMARIFYRRFDEPLPQPSDVKAIYGYYKRYWNTELGASTQDKSIKAYEDFVGITKKRSSAKALS